MPVLFDSSLKWASGCTTTSSYLSSSSPYAGVSLPLCPLFRTKHLIERVEWWGMQPYRGGPEAHSLFNHDDFLELAPAVDYFSMMTYDFSAGGGQGRSGPNAPYPWVIQTVMHLVKEDPRAIDISFKLLVGLNFYGYEFPKGGGTSSKTWIA